MSISTSHGSPTVHGGRPVAILRDDKTMTRGRQAQLNNIAAARLITEIIRTSLGPRGMDKMLITENGVVHITNDGYTMLKEMSVLHPAAKLLVEISKITDVSVGDGTTSTVVLAGALLEKADELLRKGIHPVQIVSGFAKARDYTIEQLRKGAIRVDADRASLISVARTSLQSKIVASEADHLAQMAADAVLTVAEERNGRKIVEMKSIKVEKKQGGSIGDSQYMRGIMLDQKLAHPDMPRRLENVKIALLTVQMKLEDQTLQKHVEIREVEMIKRFISEEVALHKAMVDRCHEAGANFVITQKPMDDTVKQHLASLGMMGIEKAYEYEMPKIARATGARIVNSLEDLSEKDLGFAQVVEQKKVHQKELLFLEGCRDPKCVSILVRGGNDRVADEAERSMNDALMVARDMVLSPMLVTGGGACEAELARLVMDWSKGLEGREQLAAEKYAEALESIPTTLAENAGMDRTDASTELRAKHAKGGKNFGVSADGKIRDMATLGVVEPLAVKEHVINAATEAASMILRVDNIITAMPVGPGPRSGMERPAELDAPVPT